MDTSIAISHVIYDMDGLLLNTEPFYTEAGRIIATRFGKTFDWSLKSKMIGKKAADSGRILIRELQLPVTLEEYLALRQPILEGLFQNTEPMPGALRLTAHLRAHGIPQAVATSSDPNHFRLKTRRHREWFSSFEKIVFAEDPRVKHGKPAPDVFVFAAAELNADPERCLVFEDAPAGVEAAVAAGMHAVAVIDENMSPDAYPGASQVFHSLEQFDPVRWGLPRYD